MLKKRNTDNMKKYSYIFLLLFLNLSGIVKAQQIDTTGIYCEVINIKEDSSSCNYLVLIKNKNEKSLCLYLSELLSYDIEFINPNCVYIREAKTLSVSISIFHAQNETDDAPEILKYLKQNEIFAFKFKIPKAELSNVKTKELKFFYTYDIKKEKKYSYQLKYKPYKVYKKEFY